MKRILSIILIFSFAISCVSCGSSQTNTSDQTNITQNTKTEKSEQTKQTVQPTHPQESKPAEQPVIAEETKFDPVVVMDQDGIKVTITAFAQTTDTDYGYLRFLVENNTTKDIYVQSRDVVINGYMHDPIMHIEVAAGKKAIDEMKFDASQLLMCDIRVIGFIQFYLHCFAQDFTPIVDSNVIHYKTPDYDNMSPAYIPNGGVIYKDNDIQIIADGITAPGEYGQFAYFHIKNDSDRTITVQSRNVSINGFMVDPIFSVDVVSGAVAVDYMRIPAEELSKNGIERAEYFELQFHFFDSSTWDYSFDSEAISFEYYYNS